MVLEKDECAEIFKKELWKVLLTYLHTRGAVRLDEASFT